MSVKTEGGGGTVSGDDARLKKEFGTVGLLFTAIGSIIGSGWLFSSLHASEQAGPAAIISWIVGTIMFLLIGLSYAELGVMFPRSGGVARYPHYAWGSFASYSMGWVTWLSCAAVASVEVSAVLTYAASYLHWLEHANATLTGTGLIIAIALMALFVAINYLGVKWFARINNTMVWWKLAMMVLVIVAVIVSTFHFGNFSLHTKDGSGFAPYGIKSAFEAIPAAGIAFSFLGWRQGIELAGETDNPKRNVPLTLIGSVVICGVLYILLQVAFIGAQDPTALAAHGWHDVGSLIKTGSDAGNFSPLATLATVLGMSWLAGLLYADAFISPGDTGLIYTSVTARMSYAMGRNRNAPAVLAKVNDNGVPWPSLILAWVVGCIFFLPFPSWQALVGIVTSLTVLSFGSGAIALLTFRKQIPEVERPYRAKGVWIIAPLALLSTNLIMYWAGWDQVWKMMCAVVLGYVLLGIFELTDRGPIRRAPQLDFRYGWWVLLWFAGILLVSYLGSYSGTSTTNAGQANVYGFNGGIIANIILTAVVLAVAWYCQLPGDRVREILAEPELEVDGPEPAAI
ncbi:APC family permease [Leekyejoonella antrihumi]|uniref:APC family permease n=1 Tax=Leekyejoonella antrihumi TaxID=1660198 RepID=A0A563E729_9MICO|nr:APC family permease [Leekyejoonella antrihumi]TWP38021.1 APC family permease [Leekyejoonella antrihumi]